MTLRRGFQAGSEICVQCVALKLKYSRSLKFLFVLKTVIRLRGCKRHLNIECPFVWDSDEFGLGDLVFKIILFYHLPFLVGILAFLTLHLGLTSMRATASYSYEGLVAAASVTGLAVSTQLMLYLLFSEDIPSFNLHNTLQLLFRSISMSWIPL